ncbi:MAG: 50S ribosomal protein L4 [Chloroflexota bacterium]|nr:50S ribosomal protein L4 [Chloroflexota bacterium]
MLVAIHDINGKTVGEIELKDEIFAAPVNRSVMHQALVRQLANARQGTHKTKVRSEVRGGGRKPWRQKGTGRARHGSIRSPQWRGGGAVFGPKPRSYRKKMPRKMRRQAMRSALSVKAGADQLIVVDALNMETPKTREMINFLDRLDLQESVLILLQEQNEGIERSVRNLPDVKTLRAGYVNVRDLLGYHTVIVTPDALTEIERILG